MWGRDTKRATKMHRSASMVDRQLEKVLAEPWGAAQAGAAYNCEVIGSLCDKFSHLQPQARRGALQATLFMRKGVKAENEVRRLVELASSDSDQWVSVIAHALGGLSERFDISQLQRDIPAVRFFEITPHVFRLPLCA